jgi:OmpA-OmpF porin, OOP family
VVRTRSRTGLAVAVVLMLVVLAFGMAVARARSNRPIDCSWLSSASLTSPAAAAPAEQAVVLLQDRTFSYRAGRESGKVGQDLRDLLEAAVANKADVSIGSFDGAASTISWSRRVHADLGLRNRAGRKQAQARLADCLARDLAHAAQQPAQAPGSDPLGGWWAAAERLRAGQARRRQLIQSTDGLATLGCADLRRLAIGDTSAIDDTVTACQRADELPDLSGTAVHMLGVGHPGPGQPLPSSLQLRWLQTLWKRLCLATGATTCTISTEDVGEPAQQPGTVPHAGAADPIVRFPQFREVPRACDGPKIIIPANTLFATDSAVIDPSALGQLAQVAARILSTPDASAVIHGYTDARGTPAHNLELSRRRAAAVRAALVASGVSAGSLVAVGHGARNDSHNPQVMAANRRVVVTIHYPGRCP